MAETLPTTELSTTTEWGLGTSGPGVRPGFSQTADNFPSVDEMWPEYYDNVMRGREDGPWYGGAWSTVVDYSKTYSEPSSTGDKPPIIKLTTINAIPMKAKFGTPWGGFRPTIVSPGEGNGVDYMALDAIELSPDSDGSGDGTNGSVESPHRASEAQNNCVDGSAMSPVYYAGYAGYSNPTGT